MIRAALVALVAIALSGCASLETNRHLEVAFHTINAIDLAQSINGISHGCYREVDPLTSRVLGSKPSSGEFAVWMLANSMLVNAVNRSDWMRERPGLRLLYNLFMVGSRGATIKRNHDVGLRPWGENKECGR